MKPLAPLFTSIRRVILFDDDEWKSVGGEEDNMVVVPCWNNLDRQDNMIERLADHITRILTDFPPEGDVRDVTSKISSKLWGSSRQASSARRRHR